jgi:hypothetical protein
VPVEVREDDRRDNGVRSPRARSPPVRSRRRPPGGGSWGTRLPAAGRTRAPFPGANPWNGRIVLNSTGPRGQRVRRCATPTSRSRALSGGPRGGRPSR